MDKGNNYALIMAGGVGSRLWPLSKSEKPKQFLDLLGMGRSLLQLTFDRLAKVCHEDNIYIITNEQYAGLVQEQLPNISSEQILAEPVLRNTAPCIAYAAHKIASKNPEANMVVAPADHLILNETSFVDAVKYAFNITAKDDVLVTFGIQPSRPDTGYGYIEYDKTAEGLTEVIQFKEKPNLEVAKQFLAEGGFLWNSGIFAWSVKSIISSLGKNAPEINGIFENIQYYSSQEIPQIAEGYQVCPSDSVDYAILEKADNVKVLPVQFNWSDLGTWKSIYENKEYDFDKNAVHGNVVTENTNNCLIKVRDGKLAVVKGLENFIVVDENDVLVICPKDEEQSIKDIYTKIKDTVNKNFI
ncbi:mannose-1-phosphate guanylyltransferase [Persicobacter psychrovividus]|uniref:Mannose-1-phosphate guanylyltransferase n=1 Tax=Persicobacter psychrovividus TaxID=387638 RepID=A0ABM7VJJ9_9BACT|nr:mannose-1-phosphate guanylyltransferase [Persicobacter psychrovividus]